MNTSAGTAADPVTGAAAPRAGTGPRLAAWAQAHRAELLLALLALLLYLPAVGAGLPVANNAARFRSWHTDAITPLGPLTELYAALRGNSAEGYVGYPLFHYMVLAAVDAPYLGWLMLTGGMTAPRPVYPFGLTDPVHTIALLELLGRLVSTVMATGIVLAAYRTARLLWSRAAGWYAAVLVLLMYPMTYYARTGNLDVPVLFWTSLGLLTYAHIVTYGVSTRRFVVLGVLAGIAVGTKDQAWGAFAFAPLFLLLLLIQQSRREKRVVWQPAVAGLAGCAAVYILASGFALSPARWSAHIHWIQGHVPFPMQENVPDTFAGYVQLIGWVAGDVFDAVGPFTILAALAGVVAAARKKELLALTLVLAAVGHYVLVLVPVRSTLLRYVMPISYVICLFAGRGIAAGLAAGSWRKTLAQAGFVAACVWGLVLSGDLTWQMLHDSRNVAARDLAVNVRANDVIGSPVSPSQLPRMRADVRYKVVGRLGAATRDSIAAIRPAYIVVVPDWTSKGDLPHPKDFPADVFAALEDGSLGYSRVAQYHSPSLIRRRRLDYPTYNPVVTVFARADRAATWSSAGPP